MPINNSYAPGASNTNSANLDHGFVATGPGPVIVTPIGPSDSVAVHNLSNEYIRVTITPVPAMAATFTGNRAFVVAPGSTYQEGFSRACIQDVTVVAVDMPTIAGSAAVDTLAANANAYQALVKFVEA